MSAPSGESSVSVVIATHNRCNECKQAVASALDQVPSPLEVIVCDDGSVDDTPAELEAMCLGEPRLSYIRLAPARGTPGPARNAGIARASGSWIAFLDDDDRWLPGKLAAQLPLLEGGGLDAVGSDAVRSNGRRYFGSGGSLERGGGPRVTERAEIERANPLILSSAIARRSCLIRAGGFDEDPRLRGVEDYGLWLKLAECGARLAVLDEPLVEYSDAGSERLSAARLRTQRRLLLLRARRWRRSPADRLLWRSLAREALFTVRIALETLLARR
jgi:glycosyltransferase involved in cell wall biosynthesis